jgi:PAS domain S-box-containing protein
MAQFGDTATDYERWVTTWREAVRASPLAIGLVDLSTTSFLELSPGAAGLLGTTPQGGAGLDYLSVADRPEDAAETFRLVRDGMVEGLRGRRRFRRADGSTVEVESSGLAIRSATGPDLGLWVALEVRSEAEDTAGDFLTASPRRRTGAEFDETRLTLDDHWRVAAISTTGEVVLGRPLAELLGCSIIELTHPDDLGALLFAFARASTDAGAEVRVRLHHADGSWRTVQALPTVQERDGRSHFALTVGADGPTDSDGGASQLAGDLRRIADQIEAAGVLTPLVQTADALGVPAVDLSPRQWEVVSRLVRGERVATIAAEMYLSPSTVRNHLSAIFHKVGVHSQQELLALWRGQGVRRPSTEA